jgi:aryl-alcohol dehydrogenase-like predicted oxidoreductase
MIYRTLGKTGWKVSAIGFGAWGVGGQWGAVEEQTALGAIRAAVDAGVNFFDTADAYGEPPGVSEEFIGKALVPDRDKVLIATKVGNFARRQGHGLSFASPLHVELCCDASLRRMRVETIDVYQCHLGDLKDPSIFLEAFDNLVKKGKIRAYGISTDSVAVLETFNRNGTCATNQLEYSLLNRRAEAEMLSYCQAHNIGTIVRGPLAKGILSGKFTPETRFEDSVRDRWNEGRGRESFLNNLKTVEKLRWLATPQRTMAQAALQFVISHPAISTAIPGAKDDYQARANAAAGAAVLSADELERIKRDTTV